MLLAVMSSMVLFLPTAMNLLQGKGIVKHDRLHAGISYWNKNSDKRSASGNTDAKSIWNRISGNYAVLWDVCSYLCSGLFSVKKKPEGKDIVCTGAEFSCGICNIYTIGKCVEWISKSKFVLLQVFFCYQLFYYLSCCCVSGKKA